MIDSLNIMRAVRGTTGIEGAELTEDEVHQIMEAPPQKLVLPPNRRREEQETRNAEQLMYYVDRELTREPNLPLTERLVCEIHKITTKGIDYPNNIPGKYRTHAVTVGTYIPPRSGEEVRKLMSEFIHWFNDGAPARWDCVIRALVAHFYVVSIHPFGEGNGRTARGVESFLLYQGRVNARGFYSLSNYYYRYREDYVQLLDQVRFKTNSDLTPFVLFALRGLVEELEAVHSEVLSEVKEICFRDYAREELTIHGKLATNAGERMLYFLLGLGHDPVSLKALRSGKHALSSLYRNLTTKTLSRDLNFLKQHELIIVEGDELRANLDIMTRFTPPYELALHPIRKAREAQKGRHR
jgi:Fic family protein